MSAPNPVKPIKFHVKTQDRSTGAPIVTKNTNGRKYHYTKIKDSKLAEAIQYFSSKIKKNDELLGAESGIYTWILKGPLPGDPNYMTSGTFYAIKVISQQEIGTLHFILNSLSGDDNPLLIAGELELKEDKSIVFNLQSGTFTKPFFEALRQPNKIAVLPTLIQQIMEEKIGDHVTYNERPLIDNANIITNGHNIFILNSLFNKNKEGGNRRTHKTRKARKTRKSRK
jgi:hypothetical protein